MNVKVDVQKSQEILDEINNKVNAIDKSIENTKNALKNISSNNIWICENETYFENKVMEIINKLRVNSDKLSLNVMNLNNILNGYEQVDKKVMKDQI